jgi:hypothetical protein
MHRGKCKQCGGAFHESFAGARGEDLCDTCQTNAAGVALAADVRARAAGLAAGGRWPGLGAKVAGALVNALEGGYWAFVKEEGYHGTAWDMMDSDADLEALIDEENAGELHAEIVKILKQLVTID